MVFEPAALVGVIAMRLNSRGAAVALSLVAMMSLWVVTPVKAQETASSTGGPGYVVSFGDSVRGRDLFTGKGCVVCHSINGVGGIRSVSAETTSAGSWAPASLPGDRNRCKATTRMKTRVKPIFP